MRISEGKEKGEERREQNVRIDRNVERMKEKREVNEREVGRLLIKGGEWIRIEMRRSGKSLCNMQSGN